LNRIIHTSPLALCRAGVALGFQQQHGIHTSPWPRFEQLESKETVSILNQARRPKQPRARVFHAQSAIGDARKSGRLFAKT
jgi:hypothetical protein